MGARVSVGINIGGGMRIYRRGGEGTFPDDAGFDLG